MYGNAGCISSLSSGEDHQNTTRSPRPHHDTLADSGLSEVAAELQKIVEEAALRAQQIRRPNIKLRLADYGLLCGAVLLVLLMARFLQLRADLWEMTILVRFIEAGLGTIFFISAAVLFLLTLETRWKRSRALGRSMSYV